MSMGILNGVIYPSLHYSVVHNRYTSSLFKLSVKHYNGGNLLFSAISPHTCPAHATLMETMLFHKALLLSDKIIPNKHYFLKNGNVQSC